MCFQPCAEVPCAAVTLSILDSFVLLRSFFHYWSPHFYGTIFPIVAQFPSVPLPERQPENERPSLSHFVVVDPYPHSAFRFAAYNGAHCLEVSFSSFDLFFRIAAITCDLRRGSSTSTPFNHFACVMKS